MRLQALVVAGLIGVAGVAAERPFDSAKYRAYRPSLESGGRLDKPNQGMKQSAIEIF
jgi:hypothetical protein